MSILRREFFAILGLCAASSEELFAQHNHHLVGDEPDFSTYNPRALSHSEYQLLDELAEALLPADETGPGAHAAHVVYYIDVVLTHSPAAAQQSWKKGLAAVDALADDRFRQPFAGCSAAQRNALLAELAKNELAPQTELDHFFVELKRSAIDGFYASELIQRDHLGYKGNTAITEFAGCTHANFEHPDIG